MTALTALTDNELAVNIAHCKQELAAYESEVARRRSEQEATALADYWRAHPELTEIKAGDKLLVTSSFHDTIFKMNCWPVGTILTAEQVNYNSGEDDDEPEQIDAYVRGDDGFTGLIFDWQIDVARRAYLASIDHEEAGNG